MLGHDFHGYDFFTEKPEDIKGKVIPIEKPVKSDYRDRLISSVLRLLKFLRLV
jgi:hypothetical protein